MWGLVVLGWTSTKLGLMCLAQGHNAVTLVKLEPVAPPSRVKLSTTEPLHSPDSAVTMRRTGPAKCLRGRVHSIQSIKTCSRSRSYNIFWCSTQLSMEFMLFINVKKCCHLNSLFKIGVFLHVKQENIYVQVNILVFTASWTYKSRPSFSEFQKSKCKICAQFYTEMCPWWCRKISHQSMATSI